MNRQSLKSLSAAFSSIVLIAIIITACCDEDKEPGPITEQPAPGITASPASGKAGDEITISGANVTFSTTASENTVTFNGVAATVVSATASQLVVNVPLRAGDGVVRVVTASNNISGPSFDYLESFIVSTFAGSTSGHLNGQANEAQFFMPSGVAVDLNGNVYVADRSYHQIRKITPAGLVSTFAGSTQGSADGQGENAQFYSPKSVATDADGNVYVADSYNHRIRKITPAGLVSTLAGGLAGYADGEAADALFRFPSGITTDAAGNVYVTESGNDKVRKITPSGLVSTVAGSVEGYANGESSNARFSDPAGIIVDADGNIYLTDFNSSSIRLITPSGMVSTLAGGEPQGYADGQGINARFRGPNSLVRDIAGNIFVVDDGNHKIRKMTPSGLVSTIAGGAFGFADGSSAQAQFYFPMSIAIDVAGNMYVADQQNHKIRKITFE